MQQAQQLSLLETPSTQRTTKSRSEKQISPTHELAYFLWTLQGNEGSYTDAFKDVMFVRKYMSMSKKALSQGADLGIMKLALKMMVKDGITPYSPQQAIDWTQRSSGKPYYIVAKETKEKALKQPPIWHEAAYEEWRLRNGE